MPINSPSFPKHLPFPGLEEELEELSRAHQRRALRLVPPGTLLNFSSNDYLNLARHPRVIAAAQAAAMEYGCGATASRLVCGSANIHLQLETALAALTEMPAALVFPSGYQANLAVIAALAGAEDVIFSDALNHASLIDGCRLSRAKVCVYRHGDTEHLEHLLKQQASGPRRRIIVTDALFSMDGDLAPLKALQQLAHHYGAAMIVDEAHALGVFGRTGGGICQELGFQPDVILGTLSKALGSAGGFVAAREEIIEYLVNKARPFIYSTGLSPLAAAAACEAAAMILEAPEAGPQLREKARVFEERLLREGARVQRTASQILPIVLGSNEAALGAAARLEEAGVLAIAIRPPTVPEGTARLRLSVTAAHSLSQLQTAASTIAALSRRD